MVEKIEVETTTEIAQEKSIARLAEQVDGTVERGNSCYSVAEMVKILEDNGIKVSEWSEGDTSVYGLPPTIWIHDKEGWAQGQTAANIAKHHSFPVYDFRFQWIKYSAGNTVSWAMQFFRTKIRREC